MSWDAQKNVELQEIEFVLNSRDVEGIRRMGISRIKQVTCLP